MDCWHLPGHRKRGRILAYHAVIFDLDGTLIDSMGIWEEVPDQLVRRLGGEPFPGLADALRTRDLRAGAEQMIRLFGWNLTADEVLNEADRLLDETYSSSVPLKPGAGELVRCLYRKGIPLCIATASTEGQALGAMRHFGLSDCFSFVLSCTRYGGKNRPDIFLEAARRFGLKPEEVLLVEDSLYSVRTAHGAGFGTVAVADPSAAAEWEAMRAICDQFYKSLSEFDFSLVEPQDAGI